MSKHLDLSPATLPNRGREGEAWKCTSFSAQCLLTPLGSVFRADCTVCFFTALTSLIPPFPPELRGILIWMWLIIGEKVFFGFCFQPLCLYCWYLVTLGISFASWSPLVNKAWVRWLLAADWLTFLV